MSEKRPGLAWIAGRCGKPVLAILADVDLAGPLEVRVAGERVGPVAVAHHHGVTRLEVPLPASRLAWAERHMDAIRVRYRDARVAHLEALEAEILGPAAPRDHRLRAKLARRAS